MSATSNLEPTTESVTKSTIGIGATRSRPPDEQHGQKTATDIHPLEVGSALDVL